MVLGCSPTIVAHLQVAFPTQAAQTMRFFVALTKWIRKHRGLGASWITLRACELGRATAASTAGRISGLLTRTPRCG